MTLCEYYEGFEKFVTGGDAGGYTMHVGAEVAAAHEIGLTFEQLKRFLARRTQITSVAIALTNPKLSISAVERILEARQHGAIYPKDVLARAFSPDEVHEKFRAGTFPSDSDDLSARTSAHAWP